MSVLRVVINSKNVKDLRSFKTSNVRFQTTVIKVEEQDKVVKARRFLKQSSSLELKPFNTNFVNALFGRSFDKELLDFPQILEKSDFTTIVKHSTALEKYLRTDSNIKLNRELLPELKSLELFGLSVPQKYGGAGYGRSEVNFLLECTGVRPHIGRFIGSNEDLGCRLLSMYGNEEQKEKYLPRLAEGQSFMTLAYIENGSVMDFSNFEGYSVRDTENKGYILNASKKWVHYADIADLYLVLAKKTTVLEEEDANLVSYGMFITERSNPGVKVHKVLTNSNYEDFSLFEIDFKDAFVSEKNLLGDENTCGVAVLKTALSHTFLSDAVICCSLMKRIVHDACRFIEEHKVYEKLEKGYIMSHYNLSSLTMYTFVLESVIYLLSGRFDLHEEHDLLDEAVLTKIISIDLFKSAIQKYIEILGCESLRSSSLLNEALNALHYYTVMDDNIEYLKLMVGSNGICNAALPIADRVRKLRDPANNFSMFFQELFSYSKKEKKIRTNLHIKRELHASLDDSADLLEKTIANFVLTLESAFIRYGSSIMENEHNITKLAEICAYIYAITASLSRASASVCYDFENFGYDRGLADKYTYLACHKIDSIIQEELDFTHLNMLYKQIGKFTFSNKEYPAQHPLTREY